jgi:GR25 family glycosyltransferase involved in LPS biosynthesis
VPLLLSPLFSNILFSSTTLFYGRTGISLHGAMASVFSVIWQFSNKQTEKYPSLVFFQKYMLQHATYVLNCRVARFFLVQTYQIGKNVTKDHTLYHMAMNYTKWP